MKKRGSQLESSSSTDPADVRAGRLGRPTGLHGYLGLYVDPESLAYFEIGSTVFIQEHPYVVRSLRRGKRGHEIAFEEVVDREGAERIRNQDIFVLERRELGEGEFWPEQLIGLEVRPRGGRVTAIEFGPAQDRLVIEREGVRFAVPFVDELVPVVDLDEGYVEIAELPGLSEPSG